MTKTEVITIRVTPELKAQLQKMANDTGRSVGNLIVHLLLGVIRNQ